MKSAKPIHKLQYFSFFIFVFLVFSSIIYTIDSYYEISDFAFVLVEVIGFGLLVSVATGTFNIIVFGATRHEATGEFLAKVKRIAAKSMHLRDNLMVVIVSDAQPNVFYAVQLNSQFLIVTSGAFDRFNYLDYESIVAFFDAKADRKNLLLESLYLLIASLLEKAIIGKWFSEVIATMAEKAGERIVYDACAVSVTRNPIGYKKMLECGTDMMGAKLPVAMSVAGVFIVSKGGIETRNLDIVARRNAVTVA